MAEPGEILLERKIDMAALYDMLRESKSSVEKIVAKMLAIKKEAQPKTQLRELVTQILLNFITLRQDTEEEEDDNDWDAFQSFPASKNEAVPTPERDDSVSLRTRILAPTTFI